MFLADGIKWKIKSNCEVSISNNSSKKLSNTVIDFIRGENMNQRKSIWEKTSPLRIDFIIGDFNFFPADGTGQCASDRAAA